MRFTLAGTTLVAVAFATGCATIDSDLEYRGSLPDLETNGLVLFEDGESGHAAMMDTTCVVDPDGGIAEDVDVADGEEEVLDGSRSGDDSRVLTRVRGELNIIESALDPSGWSVGTPTVRDINVGGDEVLDARITNDGLAVASACTITWLDSPTQGVDNYLIADQIDFSDVGCTGMDPSFDVDRATSTAFIEIDGTIHSVTPDGATALAQGDLFEYSQVQGGVLAAADGGTQVQFVEADGTVRWTAELANPIVDVGDLGARDRMAVMVQVGEAGRMVELDAATGEITRQFDLPSAADMVISENGHTVAMVLPNAIHYYTLR